MNHQALYDRIIANAKSRTLSTYTERHHIIPRSCGGSNDAENLVDLTPREHFLCHYLLTKLHTGQNRCKMLHAFALMCGLQKSTKFSRQYELARKHLAIAASERRAGKVLMISKTGTKMMPPHEAEFWAKTGEWEYSTTKHDLDRMIWITNNSTNQVRKVLKREWVANGGIYGWVEGFNQNIATKPGYMIKNGVYRKTTQSKVQEYEKDGWVEVRDSASIKQALKQIRERKVCAV